MRKVSMREVIIIGIILGLTILLIDINIFIGQDPIFTLLLAAAALVSVGTPLMYRYYHYSKVKKIETLFPRFLADVTKNINIGMTLPQAIRTSCSNDYGILTPYVKDMSTKISWGVSFEKVLLDFAKNIGSKNLKRTVWTIIEAHKSGGTINTVMEAVSDSLKEVEKIKKERASSVYSQMVTGYLIYIVFLGVMISLSSFLLPSMDIEGAAPIELKFNDLFRNMAIIQGIFAGLAIGKMSEGTLIAGAKHSIILATLGITTFIFFVG